MKIDDILKSNLSDQNKLEIIDLLNTVQKFKSGGSFDYNTKLEEQEKTKSEKKTYQRKEIICFYLGLILEVIGLILLMFI